MPKQEKPRLALYFSDKTVAEIDGHTSSGQCKIGVVRIEGEKIRNPSDLDGLGAYRDLKFCCQYSRDFEAGRTYAWNVRYDDYMILSLHEVERMYKLLKRADRVERTLPVRPTTFGAWACSIAYGLDIKEFALKVKDGHGWSYDACQHSINPIRNAAHHIDETIRVYLESIQPKPAASA